MEKIKMMILFVNSEAEPTSDFHSEDLQDIFTHTLPHKLNNIEASCKYIQDVTQLEGNIIAAFDENAIDVIVIQAPLSMRDDTNKAIDKIADTKQTIAKILATIPKHLTPCLNIERCTNLKNKLIYFISGNDAEIMIFLEEGIGAEIILSAYLLQITIKDYERALKGLKVTNDENLNAQCNQSSTPMDNSLHNLTVKDSTNEETCSSKITPERALAIIIKTIALNNIMPEIESVPIRKALRRISAERVINKENVPSYTFATKHGYAISAPYNFDSTKITQIVLDRSYLSTEVNKAEPVPSGRNVVIPAENVVRYGEDGQTLKVTSTVRCGKNVRFIGTDVEEGEEVMKEYKYLGSREITLLAACGCKCVKVFKKLSIGVLTIGNKLQELGQPLQPEHSYDCNREILTSLLKEHGFDFDFVDCGIVSINEQLIERKIREDLSRVNLLVTTGCSSDKDCLKNILKTRFEANMHFENVNIKPGKSTAFALCNFKGENKVILCLPGSPASVFVTAHMFLIPLVNYIYFNFEKDTTHFKISASLDQQLLLHSRPRYKWVNLTWSKGEHYARVTCEKESSISNNLSDIVGRNAFLRLPPKSLIHSTLVAPSFVPAMLVKFPTSTSSNI